MITNVPILLRKLFLSKMEIKKLFFSILLTNLHNLLIHIYMNNEHLQFQLPDYVKDKSFQSIYKEMKKFL